MSSDLRTRAIVLRRTNYGETDRILTLLTPEGRHSVLAKGVRKEKSRLAGGIELFTIADVVIHQGRSDLGTLTGAKMLQFYSNLLSDFPRLNLASDFLKKIDRAASQVSSPEHYDILTQSLAGLNGDFSLDLVQAWFLFNLARIGGEEVNFLFDTAGQKLDSTMIYSWDFTEQALRPDAVGRISAREIKLARFLLSNKLSWATKIDDLEQMLPALLPIAKAVNKM